MGPPACPVRFGPPREWHGKGAGRARKGRLFVARDGRLRSGTVFFDPFFITPQPQNRGLCAAALSRPKSSSGPLRPSQAISGPLRP